MASTIAKVKVRKMPPNMTVNVEVVITPEYRFRLWLGRLLMHAAVWVWGCKVNFVE